MERVWQHILEHDVRIRIVHHRRMRDHLLNVRGHRRNRKARLELRDETAQFLLVIAVPRPLQSGDALLDVGLDVGLLE